MRSIRGLTVERHLAHLRESLIPLAERCGRVMREALASLEALRDRPSEVVERSRPVPISFSFDGTGARRMRGISQRGPTGAGAGRRRT